jgi:hypothetical protein
VDAVPNAVEKTARIFSYFIKVSAIRESVRRFCLGCGIVDVFHTVLFLRG